MNNRFRMVAFAAAGLAAISLAPRQVSAEPEPFQATRASAIALPAIPAMLTDTVTAAPVVAEVPETKIPEGLLETPKTEVPKTQPVADDATPPFESGASLSEKVAAMRASDAGDKELNCLAGAIYFESKGEPLSGQMAVGQVIENRTKSGRFPKSYCGVVYQRGQFSFVRGGRMPAINKQSQAWKTAVAVARLIHDEDGKGAAKSALFFHAKYVSPKWGKKRVATIGNHVFY